MAKKPDVLRAFPLGNDRWCVQNMTQGREHICDVEAMACDCPGWGYRRKCQHLTKALHDARLASGDPEANYEAVRRTLEQVWHW